LSATGSIYVTGRTYSNDFPLPNPTQATLGGGTCTLSGQAYPCFDAFVTKLNASGSALIFSTFLGGDNDEEWLWGSIAVDPSGNAYVAGQAAGAGFPTTPEAFHQSSSGGGDAFVAKLSGTVLPVATLSTTSVTFGNQGVNSTSPPKALTLRNDGDAYLSITSVSIIGDFTETNTCGAYLPAGAACTFEITFAPTAVGQRTGTLTLNDNAWVAPQTVFLSGTGVPPVVTLSPTSLSFGSQALHNASDAQTVTLSNYRTSPLTILGISVRGPFAQSSTCGYGLAAGASCTISVIFTPRDVGPAGGQLTVSHDAAPNPTFIHVDGIGSDFSMSVEPPRAQTSPYTSAYYTLTITPLYGFNQPLGVWCWCESQWADCKAWPSAVKPDGVNPVTVRIDAGSPWSSNYKLWAGAQIGPLRHMISARLVVKPRR